MKAQKLPKKNDLDLRNKTFLSNLPKRVLLMPAHQCKFKTKGRYILNGCTYNKLYCGLTISSLPHKKLVYERLESNFSISLCFLEDKQSGICKTLLKQIRK